MVYSNAGICTSQCTIQNTIDFVGVGLHNGEAVTMRLHPAAPNTGVYFVRTDVVPQQGVIQANWHNVVDTSMCTVLGNEHGVTLATVEHLLAALRGCGVDNVLIEISGAEVPILDGSAAPVVAIIKRTGIVAQRVPRFGIWIERPIEVQQGERYASLTPDVVSQITVDIDFTNPVIGSQCLSVEITDELFEREIAPARTFGFADEVEALRSQGLALGASRRNAIVIDNAEVVNEEGLRFGDEFARHKVLDCLGDLALAGAPVFGHLFAHKPGHRLNNALLRELFAHPDAWSRVEYSEVAARRAKLEQSARRELPDAAADI